MTTEQKPSDAELISAVRGGDSDAYGELFSRHAEAARRLARQLTSPADVEDLVGEAFAKMLVIMQHGGGPDLAFRAYLLTAIRTLHVDSIRGTSRMRPTNDLSPFDPGVPFRDTVVEGFEGRAAARAFRSLPERWQLVLWHTEVEGQKPADVAPLLGMSANSVSALAYRAREGLRQAFLTMHAQDADNDACAWTQDNLGGYIRNGSSRRDAAKVSDHIEHCRRCMGIYLELAEVNSNLSGVIAPLVLGSASTGYLATVGGARGGVLELASRMTEAVGGNAAGVAVAGVAAALVLVLGLFYALRGPAEQAPVAEAPVVPTVTANLAGDPGPTAGPTLTPEPTTPRRPRGLDGPSGPRPTDGSGPDEPVQTSPAPTTPDVFPPPSADPGPTAPSTPPGPGETDGPVPSTPPATETPTTPPPSTPTTSKREVDAAVHTRDRYAAGSIFQVQADVMGLEDTPGTLTITSSNDHIDVTVDPRCSAMVDGVSRCTLSAGPTDVVLSANTRNVSNLQLSFQVMPVGADVIDPDESNNNAVALLLQP